MKVFAIIRVADPPKMKAAVESKFSGNSYDLGNNMWLVAAGGTPQDVSKTLGVTSDSNTTEIGAAMVIQFDEYFGRAPTAAWNWIKAKLEEPDGGAS
jgi:hypothetical protein